MFNLDVNAMADKIQPAISAFATSLGVKAEELWQLGLMMERVKGAFMLFVALCAGVILYLLPRAWRWMVSKESEPVVGAHMVSAIIGLLAVGTFLGCLYGGLIRIIVPQYALIMDILNFARNAS